MARRSTSRDGVLPQTGRTVISEEGWRAIGQSLHLSARESQIVKGVFDDLKDCAIAEELGISRHTVHTHMRRIYRKLAIAGRVQLIVQVFASYLELTGAHNGNGFHPQAKHSFPVVPDRDGK